MINNNRIRIRPEDWLIVIGFLFAPMDSLRFIPKLGIAELSLALWSIYKLSCFWITKNIIVKLWASFLMSIIIGTFVGLQVAPQESTAIPDLFIYVYFAIISFALSSYLPNDELTYLNKIIAISSCLATIWYLLLYFMASNISRSFLGATFYFGNKFTGGAENPNKLAVYICEILFMNFFVFIRCEERHKWMRIIAIIVCFFIGLQTQSSMFLVAVFGSAGVCLYLLLLKRVSSARNKVLIIFVTVLFIFVVGIFYSKQIYLMAYDWIASDSNGLKRFKLFASIGSSLKKSAIFGLGPGMHALDGQWTYHNAYLEILAMSGFVGLFIFLYFIIRMIKRFLKYADLLVLFIPLLIFGMGSFAVRNIEFWVITCFAYAISILRDSQTDNEIEESRNGELL